MEIVFVSIQDYLGRRISKKVEIGPVSSTFPITPRFSFPRRLSIPKKNIPARPLPRMAVMMIERLGVRKRKYESATNQQRGGSQQGGPSRIEIVSVAAIFRRLFFMEIVYKTPAFLHVGETGLKFPGDFYILRKFPSRRLPSVVRMDSGWNWTPWMGRSLCWRPMISPSAVSAVISRQSGKVSRFTIREW